MKLLSKCQLKELVLYSPQHIARLCQQQNKPQRSTYGFEREALPCHDGIAKSPAQDDPTRKVAGLCISAIHPIAFQYGGNE